MDIKLHCKEGFKCAGFNYVEASIGDVNISIAVIQLVNAHLQIEIESGGVDPLKLYCRQAPSGEGVPLIEIEGAESFGLEDFAETLREIFKLEVFCFDGED